MYKSHSIFIFLLFACANVFAQSPIAIENLRAHIGFLADDSQKGRAPGSEGEAASADYIQDLFKKYNLLPKGTDEYFQPFTYTQSDNPHEADPTKGTKRAGKNVVGFLDNGAKHTIVIGAHYDHLGEDGRGNSLETHPEGLVHNGADDNASGVAGLLELARHYSEDKKKEAYNFLFIAFSAEEAGLIGSKYFTNNPTIDLKTVHIMLNMDMIGRLNDSTNKLMVYGVGTAPELVELVKKENQAFKIVTDSSGIGPSDHTSFYLKDLPVLHFFTGQHRDYHKSSDDIDKINFKGERSVLEYMTRLVDGLCRMEKLAFRATKIPKANSSGGFKVSLGIMPDYSFEGEGVRVDGVTDGKPAQKGGLLRDDVIIKMDKYEVKNIYSYMDALNKFKKGDTCKVSVKRGKKTKKMKITF
jgi:Zn-dependent M28 family amino/carboxypeptidase